MKTILLIEDDSAIRDSLALALDGPSYTITAVEDASTVMSEQATPPHLFLIDRNLVTMDGLDVCRFIKKSALYKDIPVIMLSASPDIAQLAAAARADDAIAKPFSLSSFRAKIDEHLQA
ncbi:MAG: response regulator [Citrobacter freundii]|nr:MAG: response regulator [Citrobacter freundii]